jgi:hypothetical protein
MNKNISLIITKEYSPFYQNLVHFKIDEYFIIPVKVDWIEFYLINENGKDYENLDEIFEKVIKQLYNNETFAGIYSNANKHPKPIFQDIDDFENLLLIEILQKLKLKDFEIYHNSEKVTNNYIYWNEFIEGVLDYYACEKYMNNQVNSIWENPKFNIENYSNYDFCKEKFIKYGNLTE